jgi:hypothetical protein
VTRKQVLCVLAAVAVAGFFGRDLFTGIRVTATRGTNATGHRVMTEDVRFPSGDLRIAGTLYTPAPLAGIHPAAVAGWLSSPCPPESSPSAATSS